MLTNNEGYETRERIADYKNDFERELRMQLPGIDLTCRILGGEKRQGSRVDLSAPLPLSGSGER